MLGRSSIIGRVRVSKSLLLLKKSTFHQRIVLNSPTDKSIRVKSLIFIFARSIMTENTSRFVAAIDQGTSSTRVILYDHSGRPVLSHQVPLPLITPKPGWVEQDPEYIMKTCLECLDQVGVKAKETGLAPEGLSKQNLLALGITNQRETSIMWDKKTGKPLHNSLVWLDTRTRVVVKKLIAEFGSADNFRAETGLPISTYFSASKIKWLMENVPEVRKAIENKSAAFGTVDSWIMWNLTGGASAGGRHVTDVTNASRTMLMDLKTLNWSKSICDKLGITTDILPEIRSSAEVYGHVAAGPFAGVPIAGCLGDQQSALVGQRCFSPGSAKNTYGTGCFMLYNTGSDAVYSKHGLLTTVGFKLGKDAPVSYALEGSVAIAGAGIEWLKNNLGIINDPKEIDGLAGSVPSTGGLFFVPAFSGLFAPYWRQDARGIAIGMTSFTTKAHFARAMLESVAFQTTEILAAMEADSGVKISQLRVDGGLSKSNLLMQVQADLLGADVKRPADIETTARGAAYAAGLAVGFWGPDGGKSPADTVDPAKASSTTTAGLKRTFEPSVSSHNREKRMQLWKKAVQRTLDWVTEEDDDSKQDHDEDDQEFTK